MLIDASQDGRANKAYLDTDDAVERKNARDEYVINRLSLIDTAFLSYIQSLSADKRTLDSATEASQLTFSVLATVIDSARAKENLAAMLALITGFKANIDKNYFGNKTTEVLVSTMVARKKEILVRIIESLDDDTGSYSLLAARNDINEYELAGSIDGAIIVIQGDAGKREAAAQAQLKSYQLVRNVLGNLSDSSMTTKRALTASLVSATATKEAVAKALALLGIPKEKIPSSESDAVTLLQSFIRSARTEAEISSLAAIFKQAGITTKSGV